VEPACEVIAPGVILHMKSNRFTLGEPNGSRSPRVRAISQALTGAGFDAPVRINIRDHIWLKLLGNVCFNPISMLTSVSIDRVLSEQSLRTLCRSIMMEAAEVAEALGIRIPRSMIERRLDAAAAMVGHKMSMLQDLERGRGLELGAIVEAVQEIGRLLGVPTPALDTVLSLAQARAQTSQGYKNVSGAVSPQGGAVCCRA
jgi:2-dehydropantoate 2-reductase